MVSERLSRHGPASCGADPFTKDLCSSRYSQDLRTGRGEEQTSSWFYRWLGFLRGAINVKALAAATEQMTAPIAAATPKAESSASPEDAITGPIRAVATNPPVRATALFSPDAAPVWWLSTDINTAVVSGATAPAIPKAITTIAGNTPSQ